MLPKAFHETLCFFFFQKSIILIQLRRLKISRAFHGLPLAFDFVPACIDRNQGQNPVKRCFDKIPDFPLPAHDHAEHAGHHAPD